MSKYILTIPIAKAVPEYDKNGKRKNQGVWNKAKRMFPLSWNEYERAHWATVKKINDLWYQYIKILVKQAKIPMLNHPTIIFKFYFPTNTSHDWQNYTCKPLSDALVKASIIIDDKDKEVNIEKPEMLYDPINPRTEIVIEGETQ